MGWRTFQSVAPIAPEIPPVRKLDWDIRPNRFSDDQLISLAPADCGMNIPRELSPSRHLLGDQGKNSPD